MSSPSSSSSPFSLSSLSPPAFPLPPPPPYLYSLNPFPNPHYTHTFKFKVSCSHQTLHQIDPTKKKKRKPRPSFVEQVQDKWCVKNTSLRQKLPWEVEKDGQLVDDDDEEREDNDELADVSDSRNVNNLQVSDESVSFGSNRILVPPWVQRSKFKNTLNDVDVDVEGKNFEVSGDSNGKRVDGVLDDYGVDLKKDDIFDVVDDKKGQVSNPIGLKSRDLVTSSDRRTRVNVVSNDYGVESENLVKELKKDGICKEVEERIDAIPVGVSEENENEGLSFNGEMSSFGEEIHKFEGTRDIRKSAEKEKLSNRLPWGRKSGEEGENLNKSNTMVAEKTIPEPELKRLRNLSLRMVERIKVGAAGITQALVDSIQEKWKNDEVVKLKFVGPSAMNMKRIHEILERRTRGLVIWRSGSSIVLYRGMAYKLDCVKTFTNQTHADLVVSQPSNNLVNEFSSGVRQDESDNSLKSSMPDTAKYMKGLSEKEAMNLSELNFLLDELGPRFIDWGGREPLPVDADLLPSVVPDYKSPFRLLPYGVKPILRNKEMTFVRRAARTLPPHFALGRNRELQGLATAMVKLWEKSAIAKIAIKRGVQNTSNERMAEELKRLTGGTLVSRNKEYIVFYRGNDFLPPGVTKTLVEAQNLSIIQQDEEDKARQKASALMESSIKATKGSKLVAGTLAETMAATLRWGNQPSDEEREKMMKDIALARHASLVRFLETKLAIANGKVKKAEKALLKVQQNSEPALLPTDIETLTDEERFLFRRIGLSMKSFLSLGRRGIFDGTVENMHLHWKYRELVKIIVDGKRYAQVKQVAIALEAESGGVLVSVDKTTKGYSIIVYRGKNYQEPCAVRPKNLLTKRQALARSIELQRREALKHHIWELQEKIEKLKLELENMSTVNKIDEDTFYSRVDNASDDDEEDDDDSMEEDEDEAFLEILDSDDEDGNI